MSKSLAQIIPAMSQNCLNKSQQKQALLWANWPRIIGSQHADVEPIKITKTPGGTLVVKCPFAKALHIQHETPLILEKLQHFCGVGFITKIRIEPAEYKATSKQTTFQSASPATLEDALESLGKCVRGCG